MDNKKPFLLIIDDEHDITDILTMMLEEHFSITCCHNLNEIKNEIPHIQQGRYQIALTDIQLPDCRGDEIVSLICGEGQGRTPVIVMSGHMVDDPQIQIAIEKGAKELLLKPFKDKKTIIETLNRVAKQRVS